MNKIIEAFLDTLYPPKCPICDKALLLEDYCDRCKGLVEPIDDETCFSCGMNVKNCECSRFIYHFDGMVAPYYNDGYAQEVIYNYKFNRKFTCVPLVGDVMAKAASDKFGRENIDIITFVPASSRSLRQRGFNQSQLLAEHISKTLDIPLESDILQKYDKRKTQHEIKSITERFMNARDSYYFTKNVSNKNILLVDDIKTSGATLDECARQLKFAGANMVYCVTALVSKGAKSSENKFS